MLPARYCSCRIKAFVIFPFPEPPPWNAPDPVPVMRREMKLLLIELNVLRVEVEQLRELKQ